MKSSLPQRKYNFTVPWANLKPDEFTYPPFPFCGQFNYKTTSSFLINWVEFFIVKCKNCDLMWRTPMPDKTFMYDLYSDKYYNVNSHSKDLIYQVGIPDTLESDRRSRKEKCVDEVARWEEKGIEPVTNK